jgi:hypothetical protein
MYISEFLHCTYFNDKIPGYYIDATQNHKIVTKLGLLKCLIYSSVYLALDSTKIWL